MLHSFMSIECDFWMWICPFFSE